MGLTVDIDKYSGFCAGVIKAIQTAQECLDENGKLFSLGDIVHNDAELERLRKKGMVTIDNEDLEEIRDASGERLLIRAHGEPPATYEKAIARNFTIVDCTCPVVLKLQNEIRESDAKMQQKAEGGQIVIFGRPGHAEVNGLVGNAGGRAIVVEDVKTLDKALLEGIIKTDKDLELFSQTTGNPVVYKNICTKLEAVMNPGKLKIHQTICKQVAGRHTRLSEFAVSHDIIIFVSGKSSSNGKVLCELCKSHNIRTYHISDTSELKIEWFRRDDKVGICGATSTPKWALEEVACQIENFAVN